MADKDEVKQRLNSLEQEVKKQKELDERTMEQNVQNSAINSKSASAFNEAEQDEKSRHAEEYQEEYQRWMEQIRDLKSGGRRGMDTFESAMHEILTACLSMQRVLSMKFYPDDQFTYRDIKKNAYRAAETTYDVISTVADHLNPTPFRPNVKQYGEKALEALGQVPQAVRDYYESRARDAKRVEPSLPAIQPIFTVDADGKFEMTEFKRDDGENFTPAQKATLEFAVTAWLEDNGCKINADHKIERSGTVMKQDELIKLRDDEDHGIAKFFRDHSNFEAKPDEISTPAP